ncbi:hypothetical protein BSL78_10438 [Apostichopus japonicus]|uniref:EF-hand domain-containing protein n=1 Tax=Stichopus japonicus TaxID=307972 RepID=A0A2G8KXF6_STIJA|nr:hypothetical protein BSL78_10438 [Apostichopus japonicus]
MEFCKGHRLLILALLSALYFCTAKDIDPTNEIRAEDFLQATHEEFHGIDIPKIFTVYDLNRDHKISLIELSEVTSTEKENAQLPFAEADANGDNYITVEEFTDALGSLMPTT